MGSVFVYGLLITLIVINSESVKLSLGVNQMNHAKTPTDNLIRNTQDIYRYRLAPFVQKRIAAAEFL